jgi:hypothetical protein
VHVRYHRNIVALLRQQRSGYVFWRLLTVCSQTNTKIPLMSKMICYYFVVDANQFLLFFFFFFFLKNVKINIYGYADLQYTPYGIKIH